MGVDLYSLFSGKEITLEHLKGKVIALDAHLVIYQFLSTIRGPDGMMLLDSKGRPTSHLQGIFSRGMRLLEAGIKPCFVFDGAPPDLKKGILEERKKAKHLAQQQLEEAREKGDLDAVKRYSARTSILTREMKDEAKELISAMGLPIIEAPSEAEAQASYFVKKHKAYAVGTQDADAFLFGAPRVVKNLTASGRRRIPGTKSYAEVMPELFELDDVLNSLQISQDQLIALGMLSGTDYSPKGIPGIGPKKALKLVIEHGHDFKKLFSEVEWGRHQQHHWEYVFNTFRDIPVTDFDIEFGKIDEGRILNVLCDQHDFSHERVSATLDKYGKMHSKSQSGLSKWF